ncbi:hypothetical protein WBJ53_04585 [Spirosoma sp. SC4-14]|uniref:hypothetical protein n=1 Tax=Spirosoma sp. SC4-14 TaxID=3128900 RepID=UPI0030D5DBEC
MKKLGLFLFISLFSLQLLGQSPQLEFTDKKFSPSQAIHRELFNVINELYSSKLYGPSDSICVFNFSTIKFTVTIKGTISQIIPSVGLPSSLKEYIGKAIKNTEGRWINHGKNEIDCILPIIILPALMCPEDKRSFEVLTSGAQMLKYQGSYAKFHITDFNKFNTNMVAGVILSPIMIQSSRVH